MRADLGSGRGLQGLFAVLDRCTPRLLLVSATGQGIGTEGGEKRIFRLLEAQQPARLRDQRAKATAMI